ncbi:MAG: aminopeptidase P family protein [Ectothiorhodospiraceae bacterium]|nr:aminopeptidase P family protein [Ectothiorhodospiraceae bacterium]
MPVLHFSREEFAARQAATCAEMARQGLDGLVLFRQESMFWLTGYDTCGYTMFQAMYLGADGHAALLTRTADRIQSRATSVLEDIRIWYDREDASPGDDLRAMLDDLGCRGKRLGVEYHAYGLTGQRAKMVDAALEGFCTLVDASDLVRELRLVKSPAELAYVRKAGELSDRILAVSLERCRPGVTVKSIYGAMMQALMEGGGDPTGSLWPLGAGEAAQFGRYHSGNEIVGPNDQVTFEPGAAYLRYHACLMYTALTGGVSAHHRSMNAACAEALAACQEHLRPGNTLGEVYDAHARVMDRAGYGEARLAACGYTLGATYPPTWMDWPMCWSGNPQVLAPGMVFFLHMILFDRANGAGMCMGETAIVTDGACERVNHVPREPILVG